MKKKLLRNRSIEQSKQLRLLSVINEGTVPTMIKMKMCLRNADALAFSMHERAKLAVNKDYFSPTPVFDEQQTLGAHFQDHKVYEPDSHGDLCKGGSVLYRTIRCHWQVWH